MTRKLRPLTLPDLGKLPSACEGCLFWETEQRLERRCGALCDVPAQAQWYHRVVSEWGDCGRVAFDEDGIIGFIKYAPAGYFPQAQTFSSAPEDLTTPMIACLHITPDARHSGLGSVLVRAALRDLVVRGERKVIALGAARTPGLLDEWPTLGMDFLLSNGFMVVRPDPEFPLLQMELRSLAVITENLEAVLQSLKLPMRIPNRAPAPW